MYGRSLKKGINTGVVNAIPLRDIVEADLQNTSEDIKRQCSSKLGGLMIKKD